MNLVQKKIEKQLQELSEMNKKCEFTVKDGSLILGLLKSVNRSFRGDLEGQYDW